MQLAKIIVSILFFGSGIISFLAALLNWKWFFESENTKPLIKWFGYKATRGLYGFFGVLMLCVGFYLLFIE